jgi:glutathione S-transferase
MVETRPQLITFGISHFCEKARWALDWHGIDYVEIGWPPGLHQVLAKRCGAKSATLPIIIDGAAIIQGSDAIVDWADAKAKDRGRSLTPGADRVEAEEIERRAGAVIGVHVRRLAFAELLPNHARTLKRALFARASAWHRLLGDIMWPVSRRRMAQGFDLRPGAADESRAKIEAELDWLDARLADGRPYLTGDKFSRADLSVASLLATFARPKEMPLYHALPAPDSLMADVRRWGKRPTMRFVLEQYRRHRLRAN